MFAQRTDRSCRRPELQLYHGDLLRGPSVVAAMTSASNGRDGPCDGSPCNGRQSGRGGPCDGSRRCSCSRWPLQRRVERWPAAGDGAGRGAPARSRVFPWPWSRRPQCVFPTAPPTTSTAAPEVELVAAPPEHGRGDPSDDGANFARTLLPHRLPRAAAEPTSLARPCPPLPRAPLLGSLARPPVLASLAPAPTFYGKSDLVNRLGWKTSAWKDGWEKIVLVG
jgi:hypothetical protein